MSSARSFRVLLTLGMLCGRLSGHAQSGDSTWFRFRYDNDFLTATDRYYTQGIQLELAAPFLDRSPLRHVLVRIGKDASTHHVLFAEQDCFTPASIRRDTILRTDRPFAAALFIGERSVSTDTERQRMLTSGIGLGVIGPCAICAEEQMGIHRALHNIAPLGWQHQVANDILLDYAVDLDQRLFHTPFADVSAGPGAELGTYRTNADVHARLGVGRFNSPFDAVPRFGRSFQLRVFVEGAVRLIGYDASLQGGLFDRESPHTLPASAVERLVLRGGGGIEARYHRLALRYAKTFLTREFSDGLDHAWGIVWITVLF